MFQVSKKLFAGLAIFAIVAILPLQAEAQSGRVRQNTQPTLIDSTATVCLNEAEGGVYRLETGTCVQGYRAFPIDTSQTPYACVYRGSTKWEMQVGSDQAAGQQACATANGRFFTIMTNMSTTAPATTTTGGTTTGGNTGGTTGGTTTGGTTGGNTGGTTRQQPTQTQGGCDAGFVQEGPLCVPETKPCDGIVCAKTVGDLAASILRILLILAGVIAVTFSVIGGYQIMTAGSNEDQLTNGKKTLRNALIGLAIVITSYALITVLIDLLTNSV